MSQFNEDTEPLEQTMTLEDFYQAASVSQPILNLISLGSVLQADTRSIQDGKNDSREEDVTRPSEPSSRRKLSDGKGSTNPVRKLSEERPKGKVTGGEPVIPRRPEAAVGRHQSPRGNKPVTEEHTVDERRRISEDKGPERGEKRRSGQNNEVKNITKEKDTRNAGHNRSEAGEEEREDIIEEDEHAVEEEEESEEETLEEMNAR